LQKNQNTSSVESNWFGLDIQKLDDLASVCFFLPQKLTEIVLHLLDNVKKG
jgi:hypothetical protein